MQMTLDAANRLSGFGFDSVIEVISATQTQICTYLSAILLGGLVLNAAVGWWWADPLAALVMVPIVVKEGWEAIRGDHRDDCHP